MQDSLKIRSRLGDNINGYVVIAQHKDRVVLAIATEPNNPNKAVVWYLDYQGEPHTGNYYVDLQSAYHEFISRAFGWYI
ncbi:MAG: hypothetical protein U0M12_02355 [Acutalibacteraceae bacterium]|nr:hypothetical protein [Acutalibacteraceae bacterium]